MMDVYERCAGVIAEAGLRAIECPSGCVRCGACSAITDFTG